MKVLRNEQVRVAIGVIVLMMIVVGGVVAAHTSGILSTETEVEAKTQETITVTVNAKPLIEGGNTFFTFPAAPDAIRYTERVSTKLGSQQFQIHGDRHDIDWENGGITFNNLIFVPGMEVEITYKIPAPVP